MEGIFLPVFPQGSLASSVITTVWVGVAVAVFLNLRFGWVLSGLVVPGYLVPLLIVKPWAAVVIVLEGIITYLLVRIYSKHLSHIGKWNEFFGRDRFFALFLTSVIVRIFFDGFMLPIFGEYLVENFHIHFDYRSNLHSFGLIIVALLANQFWKPGLRRGFLPVATTIAITYLIVRYGLVEYTNFTMSNLHYLYEDIASSMLASPKAYILLIITAFIASRMNLRYGWEFNGILIPSLIALQWYQPMKILSSFLEAFIILFIGIMLLKSSFFKGKTIEGGRKILLFFNISFLYKFLLAYFILWFFPDQKITDYYGFGYLLGTLMAIKMHEKEIAMKLTRGTLQVSLTAVLVANIIGYSLTFVPNPFVRNVLVEASGVKGEVARHDIPLFEMIRNDKLTLYKGRRETSYLTPLPRDLELFQEAMHAILDYGRNRSLTRLNQASVMLRDIGFTTELIQDRYVHIFDHREERSWGIYLIDCRNSGNFLVEVPVPLQEWGVMESGVWLFSLMKGKALAIAGAGIKGIGTKEHQTGEGTIFQTFHKMLSHNNTLQVRGYTSEKVRQLSGIRPDAEKGKLPALKSALWIKKDVPEGLNIPSLKKIIGEIDINWGKTPFLNHQRDAEDPAFAELILNRADSRKILFKPLLSQHEVPMLENIQRIDGYLQDWLLKGKELIAPKGSNLYVPPRLEDLLLFDEEIIAPLYQVIEGEYSKEGWSETGLQELRVIASSAAIFHYGLRLYRHQESGEEYVILSETEGTPARKYWGTLVLRLGEANNFLVEVPRPLYEINIFEYTVSLFERLKGRALLIGGTHPKANIDGTSDIIRLRNKENIQALAQQVTLRHYTGIPFLTIQTRSMPLKPGIAEPPGDVFLAFDSSPMQENELFPPGRSLMKSLEEDGMKVLLVNGSPETAGYEAGNSAESLYLEQTRMKDFVTLWLSPVTRAIFRNQAENDIQSAQFQALGIQTVQDGFFAFLQGKVTGNVRKIPLDDLLPKIDAYIKTQDITLLNSIKRNQQRLRVNRFIDLNSLQSFLLLFSPKGELLLAANLSPKEGARNITVSHETLDRQSVESFINLRGKFLFVGGER